MDLILETDIGHDPDDYFAICYLHSAGAKIRGILVSIGHPYQVAIAKALCNELGLDIPIGIAKKTDVLKTGGRSFHQSLLEKYGYPLEAEADAMGSEVMTYVFQACPDCEVFICGAMKNFGRYLMDNPEAEFSRVTMQGGFLPYDQHSYDVERLDKFESKSVVPTYNLNGAKKEGQFLVSEAKVKDLRFVGKNVCHTVVYDRDRHAWMKEHEPENRAQELILEGMDHYLYTKKHSSKKFHDPTAAVCHMHPEIGTWVNTKVYYRGGGWGAFACEGTNTKSLADIDREALWNHVRNGS